ncbi:MAG: FHA domain-containing protein [Myxococcota bacterium]|nr:FHA domain-containing protein [Myxococcota bacterium]
MNERRAHLLRIHPSPEGNRLQANPFEGARMILGREANCSIQVEAAGVSATHCRVERSRQGGRLRVVDLESRNGTFVNGWRVPITGADCEPGSLLRIGEALFVYRDLNRAEAEAARLPPLPGPVNSRHPPLVKAVERIQQYRTRGGPIWLCGPPGCGRSVLRKHLEALAEEAVWSLEASKVVLDVRYEREPPPDALESRCVVFPALRERIEDLMILVEALCNPRKPNFTPRMLEALHLYDWPGNTRELRIMLERAYHPHWGAMPGAAWDLDCFPDIDHYLQRRVPPKDGVLPRSETLSEAQTRPFPEEINSTQVRELLQEHHWRLFPTAEALDVSRATLVEALAGFGIRGPAHGSPDQLTARQPPGLDGL